MADTYEIELEKDQDFVSRPTVKQLAGPTPRVGEVIELVGGTRQQLLFRYRVTEVAYFSSETEDPAIISTKVRATFSKVLDRRSEGCV